MKRRDDATPTEDADMAKANVVATMTANGVTYTATVVRRGEWPVTVEGNDGSRWDASWEPALQYTASDDECPFPATVKEQIDIAIRDAIEAAR